MVDPAQKLDRQADLLIRDGLVEKITEKPLTSAPAGYDIVNATGLVVAPGFVDLHTHLREPGFEYKETISSGGQAAARGPIPNRHWTQPVLLKLLCERLRNNLLCVCFRSAV